VAAGFVSLVMAILVLLLFRLYCEVTILFFRMNQTLQDISTKLDNPIEPGTPARSTVNHGIFR
jgi:hypothetical protein